ncbi:MAG TPA: hypothetical protein VGB37_03525 [Candidatus Lokiarchaeia archaeon]
MAEMLTDLLQNIYSRISQLGQSIQDLKKSMDELNSNIEQKIANLNSKIMEFSNEINVTQTVHIEALKDIGLGVLGGLKKVQQGLGLDSLENLVISLESFEKLAKEILNQDTVNLLLSETIDSVKKIKEQIKTEPIKTEEGGE